MAILVYSNEHNGDYPPDFGTLIQTQDVAVNVFLCPNDDTHPPDNRAAMQPKEMAEWVNANSSYLFAGKGFKNHTTRADQVILYEKPDLHGHDGINMCFGDGHVEFMRMPRAQEMIADIQRGAPKPK
jgi:prepilin-type processing-associated H-X9-DG protein